MSRKHLFEVKLGDVKQRLLLVGQLHKDAVVLQGHHLRGRLNQPPYKLTRWRRRGGMHTSSHRRQAAPKHAVLPLAQFQSIPPPPPPTPTTATTTTTKLKCGSESTVKCK